MIANTVMIAGCILMASGIFTVVIICTTKTFKPGAMEWAIMPTIATLTAGYFIANIAKLFAT